MAERNRKNPSDTLFWNDLRGDKDLRRCSLAAKGLWTVHGLPCAAESAEYGVLIVGNSPSRLEDLGELFAHEVGLSAEATQALFDELVTKGAASVDEKGRVYNRRMVRKEAERVGKSKAGKRGAEARWGKAENGTPHGRPHGRDHATDDGSEDGKTDGTSDADRGEERAASSGTYGENGEEGRWQPDSSDDGSQNGKPMASSFFSLHSSKEEVTNTGVVTTVGHAAEAGGPGSSDHPGGLSKSAKPNRGTRIPDDWMPTPDLEQFARDRGLDPAEAALEFRTYWGSRAGREALKVNWNLAFKNNCIKLSGKMHSSRPHAVAVRRAERQGDLEQFASGGMSAASSQPRRGILNR